MAVFVLIALLLILQILLVGVLPPVWTNILAFTLASLLTALRYHSSYRSAAHALGLGCPIKPSTYTLLWSVALLALYFVLGIVNRWMVDALHSFYDGSALDFWITTRHAQQEAMMQCSSSAEYFILWLTVGCLTPIAEELFFRGALQGAMMTWTRSPWLPILLPALVFTLLHLDIEGMLPILTLALLLGLLRLHTKSIYPGVLLHIVNNTLFILLYDHVR